jgi:hypothetical protein
MREPEQRHCEQSEAIHVWTASDPAMDRHGGIAMTPASG